MAQHFGSPYIPEHFVNNWILGFCHQLNFGTAWRSNCRHRTKLIGCTWWAVRYLLLTISIKADSYALLFPDQISRPWSYHIISKSNSLFLFYFIFWVPSSYMRIWYIMMYHDISRYIMIYHDISRYIMDSIQYLM